MVSPIRYRGYHTTANYLGSPKRRRSHPRSPLHSPKEIHHDFTAVLEAASSDAEDSNIPVVAQYDIRVVTGDVLGAGTDANVYITLFGTEGDTGRQQLTKKYTNLFERGRTDCFQMDVCKELGTLTKMRIEHDDTGFGSAWLLDRVQIVDMATDVTTTFLCGEWLDGEHGTLRDLHPQPRDDEVTPADSTDD